MRYPRETWTWYGYAAHFVGGSDCAYHLATRVGPFLVSTIGHYRPNGARDMVTIGAGGDAFFETFVFVCAGEDGNGDPVVPSWSEIDSDRYATSREAERGHRLFCDTYADKPDPRLS